MTVAYKLGTALAAGMLYAAIAVTPAFADATVEISGNGFESDNTVSLTHESSVEVNQDNNTNIENDVQVESNTGGNRASGNTGGDVDVDTGDASTTVTITNDSGGNTASLDDACACGGGNLDVDISDNGAFSDNEVRARSTFESIFDQNNDTDFRNRIRSRLNTGWNRANFNTRGDSQIDTGRASTLVDIWNRSGYNTLN